MDFGLGLFFSGLPSAAAKACSSVFPSPVQFEQCGLC